MASRTTAGCRAGFVGIHKANLNSASNLHWRLTRTSPKLHVAATSTIKQVLSDARRWNQRKAELVEINLQHTWDAADGEQWLKPHMDSAPAGLFIQFMVQVHEGKKAALLLLSVCCFVFGCKQNKTNSVFVPQSGYKKYRLKYWFDFSVLLDTGLFGSIHV